MKSTVAFLCLASGALLASDAAAFSFKFPTTGLPTRCGPTTRVVFGGTVAARCIPNAEPKCGANERRIMAMCKPGAASCPSTCVPNPGSGQGGTAKICPNGQVWKNTCPPHAMCIVGGMCVASPGGGSQVCPRGTQSTRVMCIRAPCTKLCMPTGGGVPVTLPAHKCGIGERLIFAGTRSERGVPDPVKNCKANETRIMAMCKPGASSCPSMCVPKPGGGGGGFGHLCPPGKVWKNTCPPTALCLVGGLCMPAGRGGVGGAKPCPHGTPSTQVS